MSIFHAWLPPITVMHRRKSLRKIHVLRIAIGLVSKRHVKPFGGWHFSVFRLRCTKKSDNQKNHGNDGAEETTQSMFKGECFVFDKRVAVTEGCKLSKKYIPCYGCWESMDRRLLLNTDKSTKNNTQLSPPIPAKYTTLTEGIPNLPPLQYDAQTQQFYLPGLTCPRCHEGTTRESLERFAQRKEQMEICEREGKSHFRDGREV